MKPPTKVQHLNIIYSSLKFDGNNSYNIVNNVTFEIYCWLTVAKFDQ